MLYARNVRSRWRRLHVDVDLGLLRHPAGLHSVTCSGAVYARGAWVRGCVGGSKVWLITYVCMYVCVDIYVRTCFPRVRCSAPSWARMSSTAGRLPARSSCSVIAAKALSLSLIRLYVFRRPRQCRCHKAACFLDFSEVVNPLSRPRAGVAMAVVVNPGLLILYQL